MTHETENDVPPGPPESYWNYRVCRTRNEVGDFVYDVREVHYTYGQPHSWSAEAQAPMGADWHEVSEDIIKMMRASSEAVLDLTGEKPRDMTLKEMVRSRHGLRFPPGSN